MKKTRLCCPVCRKEFDLSADEYECVQVTEGSCRVLDLKSVSGATEGTICFVHPGHFEDFVRMVRTGTYPQPVPRA